MEKIDSFKVNHTDLLRGIYVSRKDTTPSGDVITTFDIRMIEPNRMPHIPGPAIHAMEHLAATYLRNDREWGSRIVYWGPMGCLTGNYLIIQGDLEPRDILQLVRRTMAYVALYEGPIPGATPRDCGNYTFMDHQGARMIARKYLEEVLADPTDANFNYPTD